MKRIETRENDFILHFKEMLENSFPNPLGFKVEYYVGEDKKGVKGLYFKLTSKQFGPVYIKFDKFDDDEDYHFSIFEKETKFINEIINDLVLAGVTFMKMEAFDSYRNSMVEKEIKEKPFRSRLPRKLLFIN